MKIKNLLRASSRSMHRCYDGITKALALIGWDLTEPFVVVVPLPTGVSILGDFERGLRIPNRLECLGVEFSIR